MISLNNRPKMQPRGLPPILFLNPNAGMYNIQEAKNAVKDILNDLYLKGHL